MLLVGFALFFGILYVYYLCLSLKVVIQLSSYLSFVIILHHDSEFKRIGDVVVSLHE